MIERKTNSPHIGSKKNLVYIALGVLGLFLIFLTYVNFSNRGAVSYKNESLALGSTIKKIIPTDDSVPAFDTAMYDRKLLLLANHPISASSSATSTKYKWPVKNEYPKQGALLPYKRIIAYYGNFYSKGMGVLGQYPREEMLQKLNGEAEKWNKADPSTPVIPAIDYIALTAQEGPGKQGLYMLRMPDAEIDRALDIAHEINGIVILDVQVGLSNLQKELPLLEKYLMMPDIHLAIDPEFSMKTGARPGTVVGTFDATDINYAIGYLSRLVKENNLPPKVLVVHRFTQNMVTNYKAIKPTPEVQIVMDMDGWGSPAKKINTYRTFVAAEPVQFTGFKLFYKNDLKTPSKRLLTPEELLKLEPIPSFIQFQ